MMDPFNSEDGLINHNGGDMYINLGNVSEDVLKDGYKSFENGLPTSSEVVDVDTTEWEEYLQIFQLLRHLITIHFQENFKMLD